MLLATVVVAGMLLVSALGLVVVQRRLLTHGVEETLRQRADNIQADLVRVTAGAELPTEGDREDSFLQLVDDRGRVVAASANAYPASAATDPLPPGGAQAIRTVSPTSFRRGEFRVLVRRVDSGAGPATLVVGKNMDDVNEAVHILRLSLAISIPVVVSMLAALLWWLTGRVLRPVESIRAEAASIEGPSSNVASPSPTPATRSPLWPAP
jgi:two-component system OmpR family sensor kinase